MRCDVIKFEKVSKFFGSHQVLCDIDYEVPAGSTIAVIGPSGSGKSTLIRCVNRLEPLSSGKIFVNGLDIASAGRRELLQARAEIGMVFQSFNLYPHLTAIENIALAPRVVKKLPRAEAIERATRLLERVGLAEKSRSYPSELSGGQQQRVAIARALAMEPTTMLFDEPTSALDPEMINEVLDVIAEISEMGMTLIIVTHEMGFARQISDQIVFMDLGRIAEANDPKSFFEQPRSQRAKDFLSRMLRHE